MEQNHHNQHPPPPPPPPQFMMNRPSTGARRRSVTLQEYLDRFPPGYRFCPTDKELLVDYLRSKVRNETLPVSPIREVNLYDYDPQILTGFYKLIREDAWYFFTTRNRKYPNGKRPDRAVDGGYWKPTGVDKEIKSNNVTVGYMKSLDFYQGRHPGGIRTDWKMHEYRIQQKSSPPPPPNNTNTNSNGTAAAKKMNELVLCKIYKKKNNKEEANTEGEATTTPVIDYATTNLHQGRQWANESIIGYQGFHDHMVLNNDLRYSSNVHQNFFSTTLQVGPSCSKLANLVPFIEPINCNSKMHMAGYGTGLKPPTSHDVAGPSNSSIHDEQYCPGYLMSVVMQGCGKGLKPPAIHDVPAEAGTSSSKLPMQFNHEEDVTRMKPLGYSEPMFDIMNYNNPLQLPTDVEAYSDNIYDQLEPLDQNMELTRGDDDDDEHQPNMVPRQP
ncbi:NAC transcription factor NAM-B1-like [Cornus florida]|uniref:NAC transcription factor NAM-B1-like n=1 Tax=Cornus florida TaxID=4283 RepID=UPI002897AF7C|nr:NAC transcription factor NAM-B1-like [Cornus florida]